MATPVVTQLPIHRLDVETYNHMVDAGALEGLPVELVNGLLIDKWGTDPHGGPPIYRLDVDTYNDIVESGALDGQPVELIEGLIVDMMSPQGVRHAEVIEALTDHFASADARVRVQLPFQVSPDSMPEPDLVLLGERSPRGRHPSKALLVIEVAVSSHHVDRRSKADLYARGGVPAYWLVDVSAKLVEVRTEPHPDGYLRCETYTAGSLVPAPVAGAADLDVSALLVDIDS
ncbi:MAG TPA: Uma2 family endonuclease [Solirubrobacteraceae bacterium]|nr:Uma2 family endonuclease [Solirubrobacteraceae bacterium]